MLKVGQNCVHSHLKPKTAEGTSTTGFRGQCVSGALRGGVEDRKINVLLNLKITTLVRISRTLPFSSQIENKHKNTVKGQQVHKSHIYQVNPSGKADWIKDGFSNAFPLRDEVQSDFDFDFRWRCEVIDIDMENVGARIKCDQIESRCRRVNGVQARCEPGFRGQGSAFETGHQVWLGKGPEKKPETFWSLAKPPSDPLPLGFPVFFSSLAEGNYRDNLQLLLIKFMLGQEIRWG